MKDSSSSFAKRMTKSELETSVNRYENNSGEFSFKKVDVDPETKMFAIACLTVFVMVWIIGTLVAYITGNEWNWVHIGICSILSGVPFVFFALLSISMIVEKKNGHKEYKVYKDLLSQVE